MDSLFFGVILEVVLLQMKILENCNRLQTNANTIKSNAFSEKNNLFKDRLMLTEICRRTLIELVTAGKWVTLKETVCKLHSRASTLVLLQRDHEQLIETRGNIINELSKRFTQHEHQLRTADEKISILKDLLEDTTMNISARHIYTDKWLAARTQILEASVPHPSGRLPRVDHEQRVHDEMIKAYNLQVKECEDQVEYWRILYDDDIAKMNKQLAQRKEQLTVAITRREELQQLYNLHAGEMRAWLTFKKERAARRAREERARNASIRIQSWWRGVMVRRALGQYRYLRHHVTKKSQPKTKKKS